MKQFKMLFALFLLLPFYSFNEVSSTLYKSDKVIIYTKNDGIRMKFLLANFDEKEALQVSYYIFSEPKRIIGTESFTTNTELINNYIVKYKSKAHQVNSNKHDIEYDEKDFKIVHEIRNNKMYFYYYHSKNNSSITFRNSDKSKKIEDSSWSYLGINTFLMDVYINNKLVISKNFDLKDKK